MIIVLFSCGKNKTEDDSWENMFDGQSIGNWKVVTGSTEYLSENAIETAEFIVEDGCITGISTLNSPNTFLTTGEEYTNFVMEYEMRMDEGLNSGVQIRSHSLPEFKDGAVHGL